MRRLELVRGETKRAMEQEASSGREAPIYSHRGCACGSSARTISAAVSARRGNRVLQPCARLPLPSLGAEDRISPACYPAAEILTIKYSVKGITRVFHGMSCHITK